MIDEDDVRALHRRYLDSWNGGDPSGIADLFADDGSVVGFDGSMVNGRADIDAHLKAVFADHQPARYVGKVREVRPLGDDVALLRAVVGMVPPGGDDLNPDVNAVQSLVVAGGRVALLQSTPAQFHGRPEASQALINELRQLI